MLIQQLKQVQDRLKRLQSQKVISKDDEIEIESIKKWFNNLYEEEEWYSQLAKVFWLFKEKNLTKPLLLLVGLIRLYTSQQY